LIGFHSYLVEGLRMCEVMSRLAKYIRGVVQGWPLSGAFSAALQEEI
jgi:hypothetical protein